MKIRNGFVSNSSSSSFIVKLSKPIKDYSFEQFYNLINDGSLSCGEYSKASPKTMAQQLFIDLNNSTKKSVNDYWEKKEYKLGKNEYAVEYEDDCNLGCDMEHNFMPSLSITETRISHH